MYFTVNRNYFLFLATITAPAATIATPATAATPSTPVFVLSFVESPAVGASVAGASVAGASVAGASVSSGVVLPPFRIASIPEIVNVTSSFSLKKMSETFNVCYVNALRLSEFHLLSAGLEVIVTFAILADT